MCICKDIGCVMRGSLVVIGGCDSRWTHALPRGEQTRGIKSIALHKTLSGNNQQVELTESQNMAQSGKGCIRADPEVQMTNIQIQFSTNSIIKVNNSFTSAWRSLLCLL